MTDHPGILYVVATPIGNLDDISTRARDTLARTDMVAAEDTRRAAQLLTHLGLRKPLVSLHEHNESERVEKILRDLSSGKNVALISDAGTPLISDPGYRLLAAARSRDLPVSPVPGSCAAIAALSVAGLPSDRFRFEGFLPSRAGARRKRLDALRHSPDTLIFYESVHRIGALLQDLEDIIGSERPITLARELTKLHETIYRGSIAEVRNQVAGDAGGSKGEFTLVLGGCAETAEKDPDELDRVLNILIGAVSTRSAADLAAQLTGASRRKAYAAAVAVRKKTGN